MEDEGNTERSSSKHLKYVCLLHASYGMITMRSDLYGGVLERSKRL